MATKSTIYFYVVSFTISFAINDNISNRVKVPNHILLGTNNFVVVEYLEDPMNNEH